MYCINYLLYDIYIIFYSNSRLYDKYYLDERRYVNNEGSMVPFGQGIQAHGGFVDHFGMSDVSEKRENHPPFVKSSKFANLRLSGTLEYIVSDEQLRLEYRNFSELFL